MLSVVTTERGGEDTTTHQLSYKFGDSPSTPESIQSRRQRRRVDDTSRWRGPADLRPSAASASPSSANIASITQSHGEGPATWTRRRGSTASIKAESVSSSEDEGDFAEAVGQLSLNEDEQVRYHGKASGLHLLGIEGRVDVRNEGGIW
jgi:hypothetical protein